MREALNARFSFLFNLAFFVPLSALSPYRIRFSKGENTIHFEKARDKNESEELSDRIVKASASAFSEYDATGAMAKEALMEDLVKRAAPAGDSGEAAAGSGGGGGTIWQEVANGEGIGICKSSHPCFVLLTFKGCLLFLVEAPFQGFCPKMPPDLQPSDL